MVPPNEPDPSDSLFEMVVLPPTILQSLLCIEIELSAEHSLKASLPTVAILPGRSMDESDVHFWKAPLLILVTVDGMLILLRLGKSAKAPGPMVVIPSAISTDLTASLYLYQGVSVFIAHDAIGPVPPIESLSPLRVHVAFLPHTPDWSAVTFSSVAMPATSFVPTAPTARAEEAVIQIAAERAAANSLFMFLFLLF